ncbi:LLM class flavin-dependent oxidoreductase [Nonomuraea purpurea]|uniref:LLM class flavin-dependent oxidoreductase n=1 Tax=Nonomuraea purpurea TaxID=1849276 RepID=A0ABV8G1K1_9ACTN
MISIHAPSDPPRFGTVITATDASVPSAAGRLEAQGWDVIATGEHVSFNLPIANAFVTLSAAAAVTSRVELMSSVALLPLYPAALAAKMGAALDNVSGGRFVFGVGIGGENPREFEACGVPVSQRGARADEALEVIRRLWEGGPVTYEGRFARLEDVRIAPAPVRRPPIWVAGRKEPAMRRAARHGDGWMPYMYTPEMLADSIGKVAAMRERPEPVEAGVFLWSCVHEDGAVALEHAKRSLAKTYRQDFTSMAGKYLAVGTPERVAARAREYVEAGAGLVVFGAACPLDYADRHVDLLAEQVLPLVRAHG